MVPKVARETPSQYNSLHLSLPIPDEAAPSGSSLEKQAQGRILPVHERTTGKKHQGWGSHGE